MIEPLVKVDERDEVVEALRIGLADEIHAAHLTDLLQAELRSNEVLAGRLVLSIGAEVGIAWQRASVAARDVQGHLVVERLGSGNRRHV